MGRASRGVAVVAARCHVNPARGGLAVDALPEVGFHTLVALAAGLWNVEVVDARFLRSRRQDLMR